jgi:hypothetical protein
MSNELQSRTLIVGCGKKSKPDAINLDMYNLPGVDVVFDLNRITIYGERLPFPLQHFLRVEAEDVLEHVGNVISVVQEIGRILEVGGTLWIRGPDGRYPEVVWGDLTHKRAFAKRSFDGFDPETWDGQQYGHYHGNIKFKVVSVIERNMGLEFTLIKRGADGEYAKEYARTVGTVPEVRARAS